MKKINVKTKPKENSPPNTSHFRKIKTQDHKAIEKQERCRRKRRWNKTRNNKRNLPIHKQGKK